MKTLTGFFYFLFALLLVGGTACEDDVEDLIDNVTDPRERIENTWTVFEASASLTYDLPIVKEGDDDAIILFNLNSLGDDVEVSATYDGKARKITIPAQVVEGKNISGSGTVASNYLSINFDYSVDGTNISGLATIKQILK